MGPSCSSRNSKFLNTEATIHLSSISATFLPTHALGPVLNGIKASFCLAVILLSLQRSGTKSSASGPQISLLWWIV